MEPTGQAARQSQSQTKPSQVKLSRAKSSSCGINFPVDLNTLLKSLNWRSTLVACRSAVVVGISSVLVFLHFTFRMHKVIIPVRVYVYVCVLVFVCIAFSSENLFFLRQATLVVCRKFIVARSVHS